MATYACSDLHGRLDLFKQIKTFLKPEDTVYFLGDAGDRGPNPWELIKEIASNSQFIYMKGNHEDMLCNAMREFLDEEHPDELYLLIHNGGEKTFNQWCQESPEARRGWYNFLRKLPTYITYTNPNGLTIHLSHAGFTPYFDVDDNMVAPEEEDLLWDRDHFKIDKWWLGNNEMMVHGHTPVPYLVDRICWSDTKVEPGAYWYCNNHKVDIDCGAVFTGHTVLLNLDTLDEEIFIAEDFIYEN